MMARTHLVAIVSACLTMLNAPLAMASAGIQTYDDRTTFDQQYRGLPIERFENSVSPIPQIEGVPAPLSSSTDNAFFTPGSILNGLTITDSPGPDTIDGLALAGPNWLGLSSSSQFLLVNSEGDDLILSFAPSVTAIGFDLFSYRNRVNTYTIEVLGVQGNRLADFSKRVFNSQSARPFFGVAYDGGISGVRILTPGLEVVGIDNVRFGTPIPEPCAFALLMCGMLAMVVFARRRR